MILPLTILKKQYTDAETVQFIVQTDPSNIVFLQSCFESYEGIATLRTKNNHLGMLEITTTRSMEQECKMLLNSFSKNTQGASN
jgi:hypothetical protein